MDTVLPTRAAQQEREVREMLAGHRLHPSVSGFDIRFDDTWDGAPAVWVLLHQPAGNERADPGTIRDMNVLRKDLVARLRAIAPDREGFARFIVPPHPPG